MGECCDGKSPKASQKDKPLLEERAPHAMMTARQQRTDGVSTRQHVQQPQGAWLQVPA